MYLLCNLMDQLNFLIPVVPDKTNFQILDNILVQHLTVVFMWKHLVIGWICYQKFKIF